MDIMGASFYICAAVSVAVMLGGIILLLKLGGKNKVYAMVPGSILFVVGLLALSFSHDLRHVLLAVAPTVVGYAVLMIMINASVRDFTPENKAGQFQGVRMIFAVLLPMVIGPMLGNISSSASAVTYTDEFGVSQNAPTSAMFLCAALVAVLVFLPLGFLIKKGFMPTAEENEA